MFSLIQTENANAAAKQLATLVADNVREILSKQTRATLAVSGGKSPIAFFQALNQADLDWARVNIALVDERVVPTHHDDSNTALVREYLLQNQATAANFIPIIDDQADVGSLNDLPQTLDFALQHYTQPDVLVLGMGGDGHTASIFPQAPQFTQAIADNAPFLLHTTPVTAPHERLSMSLRAIEATPFVYLAIGGAEKMAVFNEAKQGVYPEKPISYVLHSPQVNTQVVYHD